MKTRVIAAGCVALALSLIPARAADEPKADKEQPAHEISLEVQALRSFYALKLNDDQLKLVAKFAKETAESQQKRKSEKVSDEYLKVLTNLRDALIASDDDDKIGDLEDELDQITDKEKPKLDDSFDVTKGARKRAPDVLKSLTVAQLAAYYASVADDVKEPFDQLKAALAEVRGLDDKEWTDKRDEVAEDVAWAVAGLDEKKADKLREKVVALLDKAHKLDKTEFGEKKADLEKEAKALVGEVGPDLLLRHYTEHTIADMLSNPRLATAAAARLK